MQRLGTKSLPVKEAYGPAIPLIASNDEISRNVRNVMQETFAERIDHEAAYAINEFIKKKRGISLQEITEATGLPYSTVAEIAGLLENDGFIRTDLMQRCSIVRQRNQ